MENSNYNPLPKESAEPMSLFERITSSSLTKLFVIFVLVIITLIPMSLIDDLVSERKQREQHVSSEIANKWGKDQVITSPIIALPYSYVLESVVRDAKGKESVVKSVEEDWIYVLPNTTEIKSDVNPESLKRGIYKSVVYNANLSLKGAFELLDENTLPVAAKEINWQGAKMIFGIQDIKGLSVTPSFTFGSKKVDLKMQSRAFHLFPNNMVADLGLEKPEDIRSSFHINLQIKGSKSLNFLPLANQTKIDIKGNWANPSFNGGFLPENRTVNETTFEADWNIPSFSRKLPQIWYGSQQPVYVFAGISLTENVDYYAHTSNTVALDKSSNVNSSGASSDIDMVQINFLPEVNNYQKTTRVAKYGILVIVLTFASLFFTEIIKKQRIHLVQYILIGAAMVLFYTLLLAISEHLGFNWAYLVAAVATILLIASFIRMITKDNKTALLFAGILTVFYTFIFVLMQLRDFSLIVGTVGVFIILAVLMRVSTKVNWYQFDRK